MAMQMRTSKLVLGVCGLCVAVSGAAAQDSVATAAGLPGDALDAYRTSGPSFQTRDYVVDLSPITSSWGRAYGVAPLAKSSRGTSTGTVYFNHLMGSQAASALLDYGLFTRTSYQAWFAAGQGTSTVSNSTPTDNGSGLYGTLSTAGRRGYRLGAAFMEFAGGPDSVFGNSDDEGNVIVALANFQARNLGRLYVSRINAATNRPSSSSASPISTATLGLGGVDAAGNVHLLADSQTLTTSTRLLNKDYFRIDSLARNASLINQLSQGGGGAQGADAAATRLVLETSSGSSTTLTTPSMIPAALAGRPVLIGGDFASNYLYESAVGVTSSTRAHLPAPTGSNRGTIAFTPAVFQRLAFGGGDAGTASLLSRTDNNTTTRGINLFVVNTDGSVDSQQRITLPTTDSALTDPVDGFAPGTTFSPITAHEFTSYQSQVPFRGGNGHAAIAVLPGGDLLAAAIVGIGPGGVLPQDQKNYIAVARVNNGTGAVTWTVAAHTGNASGAAGGLSKAILGDYGADGIPGTSDAGEGDGILDATPIGRIALRTEVFPTSTGGPSISAPAMDAAGNLYFQATVALNSAGGPLANKTTALLRANYNPGTGGYQLELLYKVGDVVLGANSRRNYQVQFMGVADADSADTGAIWSGNIVQRPTPGADLSSLPPGAAAAMGALVFRAKIVYDFDQNGTYADPSIPGGSGSDQAYNALMIMMPSFKAGDIDRNGVVEPADIATFVNTWLAGLSASVPLADWDGNGTVEPADIATFVNDWLASL